MKKGRLVERSLKGIERKNERCFGERRRVRLVRERESGKDRKELNGKKEEK